MYVGYAVLDGKCYRFSSPEALYKFTSTHLSACHISEKTARRFDVIHDGHKLSK